MIHQKSQKIVNHSKKTKYNQCFNTKQRWSLIRTTNKFFESRKVKGQAAVNIKHLSILYGMAYKMFSVGKCLLNWYFDFFFNKRPQRA